MSANWEKRFGAIRRAKDKTLLQECERRIAAEERQIPDTANPMPLAYSNDMRLPIDLNDEELNRISRAFGRPIA